VQDIMGQAGARKNLLSAMSRFVNQGIWQNGKARKHHQGTSDRV